MGLESHERGDKAPLSPPQQGIPRVRAGDGQGILTLSCLLLSLSLAYLPLSLPTLPSPSDPSLVVRLLLPLFSLSLSRSLPFSLVVLASSCAARVRWVTPGGSALTRYHRHDFWILLIRLSRSTRRKFDGEKGRAPVASRAVIVGLCKSLRYVRMIVSPSTFLLPAEIFLHPLKRGSCRPRHRKKGGGQQAATWINGKEEGCDDDVAGRRGKPRGGGGNSIRLQIELYAACWRDNDIYARQAYDVWSAHMLCEGGRMKQRGEREREER